MSRLASSTWHKHALVRDNYQGLPVLPGTIMLWSEIIIKACQFHLAQACFGQRLSSRLACSTWRNHALVSDYYQGLPVPPGTSMLWSAIIIKACQFHLAQACFSQRLLSRLASSTWHKHALVRDHYQGLPVPPGTIMLWFAIIIKACQFHLAQACFGQRLSSRLASSTRRNHALVRDYYQGLPVPPGTSMLWSAIIIKACQFHLAQSCFGQRLLSRLASSTWHKHALVSDYYQGLPVPPGAIMLWSEIIIKACQFHLAQACFGQRSLSRLASSTWHNHALVSDYYQGLPVPPGTSMLWSEIIGLPVPPGTSMLRSEIIIKACQFHLAQACFGQRLLSRLASSTWRNHALVRDYYQGLPVPPGAIMLWSEIIIKVCQFHLAQACFGQRLLSRFASSTWHKHALVRDYYQGLPVPPCTSMLWSEIIVKACQFHLAQTWWRNIQELGLANVYNNSDDGAEKWLKVSKGAKIRNRYNQIPYLTQDTKGKLTHSQLYTTNESQEVSPFQAGDHKAQINRRAQRRNKHKTEKNIKYPKKKYRLGTVSKIFY